MSAPVVRAAPGGHLSFFCPGCKEAHTVTIGRWTWNGDAEAPTLSPSVLVSTGHYAGPGPCWCTYNAEHHDEPVSFACALCHSFVRDGHIQFLGDCTHALAGQTVALPPWPEDA